MPFFQVNTHDCHKGPFHPRPLQNTAVCQHDGGEERLGRQQLELSESTREEQTLLFNSSSPTGRLPRAMRDTLPATSSHPRWSTSTSTCHTLWLAPWVCLQGRKV